MLQEKIGVELHGTSSDPMGDMLRAVDVVVGTNAKTGGHNTGQEMLREPGPILTSARPLLTTVFRQLVEIAPALSRGKALVALHCVHICRPILDIAMN